MPIVFTSVISTEGAARLLQSSVALRAIREEISQIYVDLAHSELRAASLGLKAAYNSKNPTLDSRIALGHLRSSYAISKTALEKTRKRLFVFEDHVVSGKNRILLRFKTIEVAAIIAAIYRYLDDDANLQTWKRKAEKDQKSFFDQYLHYPVPKRMYSVNAAYREIFGVNDWKLVRTGGFGSGWGPTGASFHYELSDAARSKLNKEIRQFKIAIENI